MMGVRWRRHDLGVFAIVMSLGCAGQTGAFRNDIARSAQRFDRSTKDFTRRNTRFELLHVFRVEEGVTPGGLVATGDGGFLGTTANGGMYNQGTVFRLSPGGVMTVLHDFGQAPRTPEPPGTVHPFGIGAPRSEPVKPARVPRLTSLIDAGSGTYLGVVSTGGKDDDDGALFSIDRGGRFQTFDEPTYRRAVMKFKVANPSAVRRGPNGRIYASAFVNPDDLTRSDQRKSGGVFTIGADGRSELVDSRVDVPFPVTVAADGTVYGIASADVLGPGNTWALKQFIFALRPAGAGGDLLYEFPSTSGTDRLFGTDPAGGVVVGDNGDLYGTTSQGGAFGLGVVYRLSPSSGRYTLLYSFSGKGDGGYPLGTLMSNDRGSFYGATCGVSGSAGLLGFGASPGTAGSIFEVSVEGRVTVLYAFDGDGPRTIPTGELARDASGALYGFGHRPSGGAGGSDALFSLSP